MNVNNGLVSVIVPVYNVEQYLDECINSITNQTYTNLQIILIDDGSSDNSSIICDRWKKIDRRIFVIHKKNAGLGMARNSGLDVANGEFVLFVDSDDYICLDTIESCYNTAIEKNADVVCFGMNRVDENGNMLKQGQTVKGEYVNSDVTNVFLPELIARNPKTGFSIGVSMNAVSGLFRNSVIKKNKWRFVSERDIISEDYYSLLFLYKHIKKVTVIDGSFYNYRITPNSLTQSFREDRFARNNYFLVASRKAIEYLKYSEEVKARFAIPYMNNSIAAMKQLMHSNKSFKEKYGILTEVINSSVFQMAVKDINTERDSLKRKILFDLFRKKNVLFAGILLSLQH